MLHTFLTMSYIERSLEPTFKAFLKYFRLLQFEYVPDVSPRGTSSSSLQLTQLTTFDGVHKTLAMKQSLDPAGQPTFITNSYYTQKKGGSKFFTYE